MTAIMLASREGHANVVHKLIECGAGASARSQVNYVSLKFAYFL